MQCEMCNLTELRIAVAWGPFHMGLRAWGSVGLTPLKLLGARLEDMGCRLLFKTKDCQVVKARLDGC